jgi:hypothetical protein
MIQNLDEAAFDVFAALAQQGFATGAFDSPPRFFVRVCLTRGLCLSFRRWVAWGSPMTARMLSPCRVQISSTEK